MCTGSRPPLQANGGGRPQPLRRAAASLSVSSPSGAWVRRPDPHSPLREMAATGAGCPPPEQTHSTATPRPPGAGAKTPTARRASPAASSRVARISRRRAARCRARTRAPNKERRGTRPLHTRPPHFDVPEFQSSFRGSLPRDPQPGPAPPRRHCSAAPSFESSQPSPFRPPQFRVDPWAIGPLTTDGGTNVRAASPPPHTKSGCPGPPRACRAERSSPGSRHRGLG